MHDKEFGLIYNRARYHHPRLGRFIQRDPVNQNIPGGGYQDGMSLYEYVKSGPVRRVDPFGLVGDGPSAEQEMVEARLYDSQADVIYSHLRRQGYIDEVAARKTREICVAAWYERQKIEQAREERRRKAEEAKVADEDLTHVWVLSVKKVADRLMASGQSNARPAGSFCRVELENDACGDPSRLLDKPCWRVRYYRANMMVRTELWMKDVSANIFKQAEISADNTGYGKGKGEVRGTPYLIIDRVGHRQ